MKTSQLLSALFAATLAGNAMAALPAIPGGPWTFDLEDRSSLYQGPATEGGPDRALPAGSIKLVPGVGYVIDAIPSTPAIDAPSGDVNQKSIYLLKEIGYGSVNQIGAQGMKNVVETSGTGRTYLPHGSGVSYGLELNPLKSGATGVALNFRPDPFVTFTDLVPSSAASAGHAGLNAAGLATSFAGFGGLVDFYYDAANNVAFGAGDGGFFPLPDLASGKRLGFAGFADAGLHLFGRGVFTPLQNIDPADIAVVADATHVQEPEQAHFINPFTFQETNLLDRNTVLYEEFGTSTGFGFGFINIIEGDPEFLASITTDFFGPGRDLRVDFQTSSQKNSAGQYINTPDGWNVTSTDPVQGNNGAVPEPMTAAGMTMGALALANFLTRRRKA
jgi:hypothetical protein